MRRAGRGSSSEAEEGDDPDHRGGGDATSGSPKGSPGRTPLKTVLQNFLNHVDTLEARKNEGEDTYEKEFQQLKAMGDSFRLKPEFSCKQGEMEVNRKKNRYKDILPFDSTRVTLSEYPGVPGSDYINANHVKGASGSNAYIAAQGPLPHTVNDFWRMVVECEVQVIVMACNETEAGKHKCERYWSQPEDTEEGQQQDSKEKGEDEERQFGKFFVKTLKMREICPDFLVRTMRLRWTPEGGTSAPEEERTVCQFHYTAWPDHGIPTQVKPLLEMVRLIRDCQASETLPVLVHCSAGCGRTGTICAIDFIWGLLRTGKLTADFSLFELVKDMRRQRIAMVQTVEQYILVHRAVKELFLEQLRVIDSHPYENVDDDGNPLFRHPDEITPDYETIFVKDSEQVQGDIDQILTQRMAQLPRTVMGTAMLGKSNGGGSSSNVSKSEECLLSSSAPDPPPKQRGALDSAALENRRVDISSRYGSDFAPVEEFTRKSDPVLFEPAKPPSQGSKDAPAQRFKKGNLRLKQADNGAWKLEELDDKGGKKGDKKKKKGKEDGESGLLLRRPSIKKIRAFFNKDRDSSSTKGVAPEPSFGVADASGEESPQSDSDIASALSKLPKFEPEAPDPGEGGMSGSKSVPSSLDRKGRRRDPNYANVSDYQERREQRSSSRRAATGSSSSSKEASPSKSSHNKGMIRASVSTERLESPSFDTFKESNNNNSNKPSLPVKRSKSMKSGTNSLSVVPLVDDSKHQSDLSETKGREYGPAKGSQEEAPFQSLPASSSSKSNATYQLSKGQRGPGGGGSHSRQSSEEAGLPPSKPRRQQFSSDNANVRLEQAANFVTRHSSDALATNAMVPDYANVVSMKRDSLPDERSREKFLEQHLAKLHARISSVTHPEEDPGIPEQLKKSLPLIARSSDSLDDEAKKMLKDCQEYLMASFNITEKEREHLLFRRPLKNRSAESSPMTTLQKSGSNQVFSSHSSPSNSYNKYFGSGKVSSPPGTIQKSVKSPTGTIQKNYCSPLAASGAPELSSGRVGTTTSSTSPKTSPLSGDHRKSFPNGSSIRKDESAREGHHDYANISMTKEGVLGGKESTVLEAQRKVSAASAGGKGVGSRERRNSFREAVEKGKEEKEDRVKVDNMGKMAYESIWFENESRSPNQGQRHHHRQSHHNQTAEPQASSSGRRPVVPHKDSTPASHLRHPQQRPEQREQRQQIRSRHAISGNYENVSLMADSRGSQSVDSSGYEPVHFRDRGPVSLGDPGSEAPHQLQSVGLVAEVVSRSQQQHHTQLMSLTDGGGARAALSRTDSGGSGAAKGNPPPYKEPPQPSLVPFDKTPLPSYASSYRQPQRQHRHSHQQQQQRPRQHKSPSGPMPSSLPPHAQQLPASNGRQLQQNSSPSHSTSENSKAYVNVHIAKRHSRESGVRATRDDLALSRMLRPKRRGAGGGGGGGGNRAAPTANRLSLGDFPMFNVPSSKSFPSLTHKRYHHEDVRDGSRGLTVKPAGTPQHYHHHQQGSDVKAPSSSSSSSAAYLRMPGGGEAMAPSIPPASSSSPMHRNSLENSSVASPPGVDLDAVAAMMHNREQHGGQKTQISRTLADVLSGAAANLRSRLNHLSSAPDLGPGLGGSNSGGSYSSASPPPPSSHDRRRRHHHHHHRGGRRASDHDAAVTVVGEQSSSAIPITVPGATYVDASRPQPYAYPHRLEARPKGPREAPSFKRRQEYL